MFAMKKQKVQIAHLNVRTEKHGDDEVLAVDVKVAANVSNDFLDELQPGLKAALFGPADGATQDMLDKGHLPTLLFSALGDLSWAGKMKDAVFTIHGAKKADDLVFSGEVKKLKLTPIEGGSVMLEYQVGVLPEAEQTGLLAAMLQQEVKVSVVQGEPSEQDDDTSKHEGDGSSAGLQLH